MHQARIVYTLGYGTLWGRAATLPMISKSTPIVEEAAKTSTSLVQANRTAVNLFRDELAAALRAEGRTVNTEVFNRTPFGPPLYGFRCLA